MAKEKNKNIKDDTTLMLSRFAVPDCEKAKIDVVAQFILSEIWKRQDRITNKSPKATELQRLGSDVVLIDGSRQTYNLTLAITEDQKNTISKKKTVWIAANLTDVKGEMK